MKPGDHPEFFRFPAPEGRSRESTLRLDGEGRFFHDGALVEHPKLAAALHTWIGRHPEDGRYILTNGYDWTYFEVEDVPFFVRNVRVEAASAAAGERDAILVLSDGTEEALDPSTLRVGPRGDLYLVVKREAKGGPFDAKMTRFAQTQLDPFLSEENGDVVLTTKHGRVRLPA
jgi:FtsP/CotA-like multicopper oxidase with cupredoxin domain